MPQTKTRRLRVGRVLQVYRTVHEISLRNLGKQMGVSASTLCRIERGDGVADWPTMWKILTWLCAETRESGDA